MDDLDSGTSLRQTCPTFPNRDAIRWKRYRLLAFFLARQPVTESVVTRIHFGASPDELWNSMIFYEEVPGRPPWLLRLFLPMPARTEGDKRVVGSLVHCAYNGGDLVKRITIAREPSVVQFEVVEQKLGIEDCIVTRSGCYEIRACGDGADVVLTTNFEARLRPRRLWRPLERFLAHRLHRHILDGMSEALACAKPAGASRLATAPAASGGLACTSPPSRSRH